MTLNRVRLILPMTLNRVKLILLMTLNRVKLGRAVVFMKCLATAVPLIFLPKTFNLK